MDTDLPPTPIKSNVDVSMMITAQCRGVRLALSPQVG